ncbi:hypothetical protein [Mycolicibacterium baixiangningiae]|uniref:hypothetical protein n=1 Tax=Mycolicibacterium baixiangningiae TaxID=2761578 RepID=UPI0018668B8F|nr:hypothetical protein [Mycolicibacterium baixiangningiae]
MNVLAGVFVVCGVLYALTSYSRELATGSARKARAQVLNALLVVSTICATLLAVVLSVVHMILSI